MNDKLTIEECEMYVDTPDNKYLVNVNVVLQQLADTMRENERLRDAIKEVCDDWDSENEPWEMPDSVMRARALLSNKDSEHG